MQIPPEIIDKIRQAADIVDIIGSYITLKKKGANYWGPCPFHSEKTASFSVSPAKQIFKCFGCGEGGNVFTFLQKYDGLSFPKAVRQLGKKYNIEIPENELTQEELEKIHRRESLQVVLRAATHFFRQHQTDKNAEKYLTSRGFTSGDKILEQYHIGYAPASNKLRDELQRQGYDLQLLQDNSLIKDGKNGPEDKFQDRIMFPIFNLTGNPIGFQSRRINDALTKIPKYCNSDNNELFCKGSIIFGLYQARGAISREDKVYWVEGQFDVLTFVKAEIPNTVCGSGTAMTEEQIRTLLRFTRNITLIYDGDNAGQEAAQEADAAHRCRTDGHADQTVLERLGNRTGQAQQGEGQHVVQQDHTHQRQQAGSRGRVEAQQHLQQAVDEAREQSPFCAVAVGDQDERQHAQQGDGAAVGHLKNFDVRQHGAQGDHQGALHKSASLGIGFGHGIHSSKNVT